MSETPYIHRDVSTWRSVLGISHGLTDPMTNYTDPITLLVFELETLSATSVGRRALRRVEATGVDTLGCTTLKELAQCLAWDPRRGLAGHPTLLALVPLAPNDPEIALVVMVALRRPLRDMWFSITRVTGDPDVGAELLTVLWSLLTRADDGGDLDDLMASVYRGTRQTIRRGHRQQALLVAIDDMDFADCGPNPDDVRDDPLGRLMDQEVISPDDADLIRSTRGGEVTLAEFARVRAVSYDSLRMRRRRIERIVASHLRISSGPR
jgi:hypothetical protein